MIPFDCKVRIYDNNILVRSIVRYFSTFLICATFVFLLKTLLQRITSRKAVDDDYFWSSDPLPKPEE